MARTEVGKIGYNFVHSHIDAYNVCCYSFKTVCIFRFILVQCLVTNVSLIKNCIRLQKLRDTSKLLQFF